MSAGLIPSPSAAQTKDTPHNSHTVQACSLDNQLVQTENRHQDSAEINEYANVLLNLNAFHN